MKMDFDSVMKAGSRMGTGTMIVLDDKTCPIGALHNLEYFFARESCGWCTPCREGLPWATKILAAIENGHGRAGRPGKAENARRQSLARQNILRSCSGSNGAAQERAEAVQGRFRTAYKREEVQYTANSNDKAQSSNQAANSHPSCFLTFEVDLNFGF